MPLIIIGFILFVAGGDQVFPGELGKASKQTRTAVNQFFVGLFPAWEPKTKPYERTEKELRKIEQKR
jgi:hypothetical protein